MGSLSGWRAGNAAGFWVVEGNVDLVEGLMGMGLGLGFGREGVGLKGRWLKEDTTLRERSMEDTISGTRDWREARRSSWVLRWDSMRAWSC